jgi:7-cyano-7-deazaguanine synthase in queuosine biosynthesis
MDKLKLTRSNSTYHIKFPSDLPLKLSFGGAVQRTLWTNTSLDLIEIASAVLFSDRLAKKPSGVYSARQFSLEIPVREPELWNACRSHLDQLISFLSNDLYSLAFYPKKGNRVTPAGPNKLKAEKIVLFSGGLDSGAAAAEFAKAGVEAVYVTEYVTGIAEIHKLLVDIYKAFGAGIEPSHATFYIRPQAEITRQFKENTRRTRTFLYASLALGLAGTAGIPEVCICENGPLAMNLPFSPAMQPTRHTHIAFLQGMEELAAIAFNREIRFVNPYELKTKGEMTKVFHSQPELAIRTNSCWYRQFSGSGKYYGKGHCGHCIPCLVRLASLHAAGISIPKGHFDVDIVNLYRKSELGNSLLGDFRSMLVFCNEINQIKNWREFIRRYPEVIETKSSINDYPSEQWYNLVFQLIKRFVGEINRTFNGD